MKNERSREIDDEGDTAGVDEAKVAYNHVLREKLEAGEAKAAELAKKPDDKAPSQKAGATPIDHGEAAEDTDLDFMALSRAMAARPTGDPRMAWLVRVP